MINVETAGLSNEERASKIGDVMLWKKDYEASKFNPCLRIYGGMVSLLNPDMVWNEFVVKEMHKKGCLTIAPKGYRSIVTIEQE